MADTRLQDMTAAAALGGTELFYAVQSGGNTKVTTDQIKTYVFPSYLEFFEIAAPGSPGATGLRLYAKNSSGTTKLFTKTSAGVETEVGAPIPAGATTQVQYNNGGLFGGDTYLTWDNVNKRFSVGGDFDLQVNPTFTLRLISGTTGTAGVGLGAGLDFYIENAAGTFRQAGGIAARWSDPTNASEDADLYFYTMNAGGAMSAKATLSSVGGFYVAELGGTTINLGVSSTHGFAISGSTDVIRGYISGTERFRISSGGAVYQVYSNGHLGVNGNIYFGTSETTHFLSPSNGITLTATTAQTTDHDSVVDFKLMSSGTTAIGFGSVTLWSLEMPDGSATYFSRMFYNFTDVTTNDGGTAPGSVDMIWQIRTRGLMREVVKWDSVNQRLNLTNPGFAGDALFSAGAGIGAKWESLETDYGFVLDTSATVKWTDGAYDGTPDLGIERSAAGVLEINSGTTGTYREVLARSVKHNGVTVANLPGSPSAGQVACVTDATATTTETTVAGGGANTVMVWYDGTDWTIFSA